MREYVVRRLLLIVPIIIGVSLLTFLTFRVIPGDVTVFICQLQCTDETRHDIRVELGLDKPIYKQYTDWVEGVAHGDFGDSYLTKSPINAELNHRFPVTLELLVLALFLSTLLGIPAGIFSAVRPGSIVDMIVRLVSVFWLSIPSFYIAILLITFGASWLGWSPPNFATGTTAGLFTDPVKNMEEFLPPAFVLSVGIAAVIMRLTRSSMLEVMRNDYIRTAYSKGLRERAVVWRHALKNAMIPVATIIGLQVGGLIGGAVLVESVFNLPGMGVYLVQSIETRDIPVVEALVLIFALAFVVINLIVDLTYAWLDPRIHYG
jgi:peptide/nickel transport system permease protein